MTSKSVPDSHSVWQFQLDYGFAIDDPNDYGQGKFHLQLTGHF
jgi:hypothetical protein